MAPLTPSATPTVLNIEKLNNAVSAKRIFEVTPQSFRENSKTIMRSNFAKKIRKKSISSSAPPPFHNSVYRIRTIFKPITKLSTVLASGKDAVPARKRRGVAYEIPCGSCEHRYIGETKRSLSTRLKEHHRDTLPRNILKNPEKTALRKHAAQSGHAFNWDYARVLHNINSYHKHIFLESLYINLRTNTVNDKSSSFPAIYYNVLKHERSLSITGLPWVCILIDRLLYL